MASSRRGLSMTQAKWQVWAQQRIADAPKIAKLYEAQGKAVALALAERGCTCNPIITMPETTHGGTNAADIYITHAMDCESN